MVLMKTDCEYAKWPVILVSVASAWMPRINWPYSTDYNSLLLSDILLLSFKWNLKAHDTTAGYSTLPCMLCTCPEWSQATTHHACYQDVTIVPCMAKHQPFL